MKWFKLYADLQGHPKRWRFEELADTEHGLHYLTCWFSYICKFAPTGDVNAFSPREVARACEWRGDPQKLWDALLGAGFIDQTPEGYFAHDWAEEHSRFITENKPKGSPRVTQGLPLLEENRVEEKRKEKPKPAASAKEFEKDEDFMKFWNTWPRSCRKGSPVPAFKAWQKAQPPLDQVLAFLAWKKKTPAWTGTDQAGKDFIPMPSTFLNGAGWLEQRESGPSDTKPKGEYKW